MDVFVDDRFTTRNRLSNGMSQVAMSVPLRSSSFDSLVAEAKRLADQQVRHVSIRRQQVLRLGELTIREVLDDHGIRIGCMGFIGGFTGALGVSYQEALDDAVRGIELATELNACSVVVLPGDQGLHTYRHAERTVRDGLTCVAQCATQYPIRFLVPTDTVLLSVNDCFRPKQCLLSWLGQMDTQGIHPLIVVRGHPGQWRLPFGWRQCIASGGFLRVCHQCDWYDDNTRLMGQILKILAR